MRFHDTFLSSKFKFINIVKLVFSKNDDTFTFCENHKLKINYLKTRSYLSLYLMCYYNEK